MDINSESNGGQVNQVTEAERQRAAELAQMLDAMVGGVLKPIAPKTEDERQLRATIFESKSTAHDPPMVCHYCEEPAGRTVNGTCGPCFIGGARVAGIGTARAAEPAPDKCGFCGKIDQRPLVKSTVGGTICPACVVSCADSLGKAGVLPGHPAAAAQTAGDPRTVGRSSGFLLLSGAITATAEATCVKLLEACATAASIDGCDAALQLADAAEIVSRLLRGERP